MPTWWPFFHLNSCVRLGSKQVPQTLPKAINESRLQTQEMDQTELTFLQLGRRGIHVRVCTVIVQSS